MSHLFPAEPPTETLSNQEYTAENTESASVEHCKCFLGASTEYYKFSIKISNASKGGGVKLLAQLSYYTKTVENMLRIGHACLDKEV